MVRGREIVWCAFWLLAGDVAGFFLAPDSVWCAPLSLAASAAAGYAALRGRSSGANVTAAFFLAGFSLCGVQSVADSESYAALLERASFFRARASSFLEAILDPASDGGELPVVKALLTGDRSSLSRSAKAGFRLSGASHILALSGLHVGIIYKILKRIASPAGKSPVARVVGGLATLAALWAYAFVSGMSASIARATLMVTIFEAGLLSGRRSDGLNSLALSAIAIMVFDPSAPWDISFQMSFSACLAIFVIFPYLRRMLSTRMIVIRYIWESAALAISCQMTTGVLAWAYFGTFPRYFLITNLLAVPLVWVIIHLAIVAAVTFPIQAIAPHTAAALRLAVRVLNYIVGTIADL